MKRVFDNWLTKIVRILSRSFHYTPIHRLKITGVLYRRWVGYMTKNLGEIELKFRDLLFVVPTRDVTILPGLLTGGYEKIELDILRNLVNKGDVFIDAGANIGIYTVIGSKLVGPKGKVISFEPEPNNFKYLRLNSERNGNNNITLENLALGSDQRKVQLFISEDSIGSHTMILKHKRHIRVNQTDLDSYLQAKHLYPQVVKIDVEGYEPEVLAGMTSLIAKSRPTIFMEYVPMCYQEATEMRIINNLMAKYPFTYFIDGNQRLSQVSPTSFPKRAYGNLLFVNNSFSL